MPYGKIMYRFNFIKIVLLIDYPRYQVVINMLFFGSIIDSINNSK